MDKKKEQVDSNSQKAEQEALLHNLAEQDSSSEKKKKKRSLFKRKDKNLAKKQKEKKKHSLIGRILLVILKVIIYFLLIIFVLLLLGLLIAKLYLSPARVESLIQKNFAAASTGRIELKVNDFSPYSGFDITDLIIYNGPEFENAKFAHIKRLHLDYGFFGLLAGNVKIREVGVYQPTVWIKEKAGLWNYQTLMKPSGVSQKKEEEKEKGANDKKDSIALPLGVEVLFKFILDDLSVYAETSTFSSQMKGLSFSTNLEIPEFTQIPLDLRAVKLLKDLTVKLNPEEKLNFCFESKDAKVSPPLILNWNLLLNRKDVDNPQFISNLKLGTYKTPVRFKNSHLTPLNFLVSYDMFYNPQKDEVNLQSLSLKFKDNVWLDLGGKVTNLTKNLQLALNMKESDINLSDLYPYYSAILDDQKTKFSGHISLYPLKINGPLNKINAQGNIFLKNISFVLPEMKASLPKVNIAYSALYTPTAILANVDLKSSNLLYKSSAADANIPYLNLLAKAKLLGENGSFNVSFFLPNFTYKLNKEVSAKTGFKLKALVDSSHNFGSFKINNVSLNLFNPLTQKNALRLLVKGNVALKPFLQGHIEIPQLLIYKERIQKMLPASLKMQLQNIPLELKKPINLDLVTNFALPQNLIKADLNLGLAIPDLELNDLSLQTSVQMKNNTNLNVDYLMLDSNDWGLDGDINGFIDLSEAPLADSDLKVKFILDTPSQKKVYAPWVVNGKIVLNAIMKGNLKNGKAAGDLNIEHLNAYNDVPKNERLEVNDFNLNFPFEYSFKPLANNESRLVNDKSLIIANENFKDEKNFTIKSVKAPHLSRSIQYEWLKDLEATMFFRNNAFEIVKLQTSVMNGTVYAKNILLDLSKIDLNKGVDLSKIEYMLTLGVTNLDAGQLDNPDPNVSNKNAKLSLNASFKGKGLDINNELNANGYINIYKIGNKFANKLMKGLNSEEGKSKLGIAQVAVDHSLIPKSFYFNLFEGNVYPTVTFERRMLGFIVSLKEEKVEYDRIPIQEYLRKVKKGK